MCVHELPGVFEWSVTVLKLFRVDSQLQQGAVLRPTLLKNHSITNHTNDYNTTLGQINCVR